MQILHNCSIPTKKIPIGVLSVRSYWKCPTCGEKWEVTHRATSHEGSRIWPPGLKNLRWQRKQRRMMK